jgi:hypothetical protein
MKLNPIATMPPYTWMRVMLWAYDGHKNRWIAWEGKAVFRETYTARAHSPPVEVPTGWHWPDFEIYHGITFTATHWSPAPDHPPST